MSVRTALTWAVVIALWRCMHTHAADPSPKDQLIGTWIGISYQQNGERPKQLTGKKSARLVLTQTSLFYHFYLEKNIQERSARFSDQPTWDIDATKKPMHFLKLSSVPKAPPVLEAGFQLDDDRLIWRWLTLQADASKPIDLVSPKGDFLNVIVFRREKAPGNSSKSPEPKRPSGDTNDSK